MLNSDPEANMAAHSGRVVVVAGASGLVGREMIFALLADPAVEAIHCLGRRPLAFKHPKLHDHVVDFKSLPTLPHADECYIALGTTIQAAGSQEAFQAIDLNAVMAVAAGAHSTGTNKFGVVSAMGADPQSRVFYNRVKGQMELGMV
jgi:uncharacterized protein YbjT (DUF2867 family)